MGKHYTVSDGKLVLILEEVEEGGYVVTSPMVDPELVTEAETLSEAFYMARDALETLRESRVDLFGELPLEGRARLLDSFPEAERTRLLRTLPARERREVLRALAGGEAPKEVGKRRSAARRKRPRKGAKRNRAVGSKA